MTKILFPFVYQRYEPLSYGNCLLAWHVKVSIILQQYCCLSNQMANEWTGRLALLFSFQCILPQEGQNHIPKFKSNICRVIFLCLSAIHLEKYCKTSMKPILNDGFTKRRVLFNHQANNHRQLSVIDKVQYFTVLNFAPPRSN